MQTKYILCIIISAFMHAFYNYLIRKSGGNKNFLACMLLSAGFIGVAIALITGDYRDIPWQHLPYIYSASFFYIVYQVFTAKAYEKGKMTTNYPLTVLSPMFIPIWAFIFLSERISFTSGFGILVSVIGVVLVKINSLSLKEFKSMLMLSEDYRGARFALGASLAYSFGAVLDKSKVAFFHVTTYIALMIVFMSLNMLVYLYLRKDILLITYFKSNWKMIIPAGVAAALSFLFFRIPLQVIDVSIAVPIRQISIVFAVFFGVFSLKEPFELSTFAGSLLVISGIVIVSLGV